MLHNWKIDFPKVISECRGNKHRVTSPIIMDCFPDGF